MADPFRLRVQQALTTKLEEITTTLDGTSLVGRVFRGRALFGDNDPLPMISILEEPVQEDPREDPRDSTFAYVDYRLMLQGFVEDDVQNPTDPAHFLMADVLIKLAEIRSADGKILDFPSRAPTVETVDFGPGVVRPPDDEISAKAYFWLPISLRLIEDYSNPYA